MCSKLQDVNVNLKSVGALRQDDVDQLPIAHADTKPDVQPNKTEDEIPAKKRKRRRRNKRRHPYLIRNRDKKTNSNVIKPEAPHNSNQFLIEDQGNSKEIEQQLIHDVGVSRTRDSSFSMDSDAEFYSSPDDEEAFLRKDFDDAYENIRADNLNLMTKNQLIEEFLILEKRVEVLTKNFKNKGSDNKDKNYQYEIDRLILENSFLKRENNDLRNKLSNCTSDSKDSESDSSESCSSCSSSDSDIAKDVKDNQDESVDYTKTNGHSPAKLNATQ